MTKINTDSIVRPLLNSKISAENFINFYWLKKELISFCQNNNLLSFGSKEELTARIHLFLITGKKETLITKTPGNSLRDSTQGLTLETPVINYKNDALTSQFFKKHIGAHFHFNSYLRQFAKNKPLQPLTYADLIKGWLAEENRKDAIKAWNLVKSTSGPCTYQHYLQIKNN